MKRSFWGILLPLAGLLVFSQVIVRSTSFNQRPVRVSDETNKQPDQASRYVWAFDNPQSEQYISGETTHEFTSLKGEVYGRKGVNVFIINGEGLADGVYVLVLQAGNQRSTYKLVILH